MVGKMQRNLLAIAGRLFLVCLTGSIIVSIARATDAVYVHEAGRFTVRVPEGWVETPKATFDIVMGIASAVAQQKAEFATGFHRKDGWPFQMPFVLLQYRSVVTPPSESLIQRLNENKDAELATIHRCLGRFARNAQVTWNPPKYDRARKVIWLSLDVNGVAQTEMKVVVAFCLGRDGMAQLTCYTANDDDRSKFEKLVDALVFEHGAEFNDRAARAHYSSPHRRTIDWLPATAFLVVTFTVFAVIRFVQLRLRRRKQTAAPADVLDDQRGGEGGTI